MHGWYSPHVSFLVVMLSGTLLFASSPKVKVFRTQQDFAAGELNGVSIDHLGRVSLAPKMEDLHTSELPFLWAGASDRNGNVYVAGGNPGQVLRINTKGATDVIFETPEIQIYALATDDAGTLYVGSSPDGKVYKLPAGQSRASEPDVVFDPPELYIWSLVVDSRGNLFVATGETGNIYKVDKQGKSTLFFESGDNHVRKIIFDVEGNLIAGTASKGQVLRISPAGKAFVLYDSPLVEITDLVQDRDGNIFAAATGDSPLPRSVRPAPANTADKKENGNGQGRPEDLESAQAAATLTSGQTGELYRIGRDGHVRSFQMLKSERIYSLAYTRDGKIFVGAGENGRLYSMTSSGDVVLLATVDAAQVTVLVNADQSVYLGTSNSGRIYRVAGDLNSEGHFKTEVVDAGVSSRWGAVSWEAMSMPRGIGAQTRSGNTEEPDKTWSDWSPIYKNSEGQAITSPRARFIQLKTVLSLAGGVSPVLDEVSFSYLQKNIAPAVKQVRIHEPGEYYPESLNKSKSNGRLGNGATESDYQNSSMGRKANRKGYRSVSWVATDDNQDRLSYNLYYKTVADSHWKFLAQELTGIVYSWDSELMPDGRYLVKLEAFDDLSNPPALVLSSEMTSQLFTIDNTGPKVSDITVRQQGEATMITFVVSDESSKIESVEYGVNVEDWRLVYPEDGICDSKRERFSIQLDASLPVESALAIKATDTVGNIGFGRGSTGMKR